MEAAAAPTITAENATTFCYIRAPNSEEARGQISIEVSGSKDVHAHDKYDRVFSFTKSFDGSAGNDAVFDAAAKPFIDPVMRGYSCFLFVCGQHGSGKTKLVFGNDGLGGLLGNFGSALHSATTKSNKEVLVSVTCLQLCNEELKDLLGVSSSSALRKLRMMDEVSRKGTVSIQGLCEVVLRQSSPSFVSEIVKNLGTGNDEDVKRSHVIVTFTVHVITITPTGENVVTGKMSFVLVGSGDVSTSKAAPAARGRDASNAYQSFNCFQRLVTMFAEGSKHFQYRESKLTRFVQDAFGGKSKSAFLFTVSPSQADLSATIATLEFGAKAKNVISTPEVCSTFSKTSLLRRYEDEMNELQKEIQAAVTQDGMYVTPENYERLKKESEEHVDKMRDVATKVKELTAVLDFLNRKVREDDKKKTELKSRYNEADAKLKEETEFNKKAVSKYEAVRAELQAVHQEGKAVLDDLDKMHNKHEREASLARQHAMGKQKLGRLYEQDLAQLRLKVDKFKARSSAAWNNLNELEALSRNMDNVVARKNQLRQGTEVLVKSFESLSKTLQEKVRQVEKYADQRSAFDEARTENLRSAYLAIHEKYVAQFEKQLATLENILASSIAFCASFSSQMKDVSAKVDARKKITTDMIGRVKEISEQENQGAEAAVAEAKAASENIHFGASKLQTEDLPRVETMTRQILASLKDLSGDMGRLRGQGAGGFFTNDCDRFEVAKKEELQKAGKLISSADAERKAAVGKVVDLVKEHGMQVSETLEGMGKVLAEVNADIAACAHLKGAKLSSQDKEQEENCDKFKYAMLSQDEAYKTVCEAMQKDAELMVETDKKAGADALAAIQSEVDQFTNDVYDAKEVTEDGVVEISENVRAVVARGVDLERDFVQTLQTGATPARKQYNVDGNFTKLTPRHL